MARSKAGTTSPRRWRNYRQDSFHVLIQNLSGRRIMTKRQFRNRVKKNADSVGNPLGARHKMGINKAFEQIVESGLITCAGENEPVLWATKGKDLLRAQLVDHGLSHKAQQDLAVHEVISIARSMDVSSSTRKLTKRSGETKAKLKAEIAGLRLENQRLRDHNSRLQAQNRKREADLDHARGKISQLEMEDVEMQLYGPLTPPPTPRIPSVEGEYHPAGTFGSGSPVPPVETNVMDEAGPLPRTPSPSPAFLVAPVAPATPAAQIAQVVSSAPAPTTPLTPPPVVFAPRPVRPGCLTASGSWINPMSKQPSPAPTQTPGDEHDRDEELESENATMVGVDGDDDDSDDEESRQSLRNVNNGSGQLPTPDNTPVRPVRSQSNRSLVSPPVVMKRQLEEKLVGTEEEGSQDVSELESQLTARAKELEDLTTERDDIQAELEATVKTCKAAKKANDRFKGIIAWVKGKNLDLHKDKLKLKRKIGDLEDEIERKNGVMDRLVKEFHQEGPPKKRKRVSI